MVRLVSKQAIECRGVHLHSLFGNAAVERLRFTVRFKSVLLSAYHNAARRYTARYAFDLIVYARLRQTFAKYAAYRQLGVFSFGGSLFLRQIFSVSFSKSGVVLQKFVCVKSEFVVNARRTKAAAKPQQYRVACVLLGIPRLYEIAVRAAERRVDALEKRKVHLAERFVRFLCFVGLVLGRKRAVLFVVVQPEYVEWAVLDDVSVDTGLLRAYGKFGDFWRKHHLFLAVFVLYRFRFFHADDIIYTALGRELYKIVYVLFAIAVRNFFFLYPAVIAKCFYQHFSSFLYSATSITPSIMYGW